jgi:hypothetical protein
MAASELLEQQEGDGDDRELVKIIDDEIAGAICFANDTERDDRVKAIEYYMGRMADLPAEKDWSHAISKDVADTIDSMMPGLMRVFAGAGQVVVYSPNRPGDEQAAAQATDYINYIWGKDDAGYLALMTAILDALMVGNGIIKAYWDKTPEYETEELCGLSDEQLTFLLQDQEAEIIGYSENPQQIAPGQVVTLHDVRVRRVSQSGRLVIEAVPPDNFGISKDAKNIDRARCVWERASKTRSDLVEMGFDKATVSGLPAWTNTARQSTQGAVWRYGDDTSPDQTANAAMVEVEVYEVYLYIDTDGDGIAEHRKVLVAGESGSRRILSNDPYPDDRPYVDLNPKIIPHQWRGCSVADDTMDLQRVKTALLRGFLDNTYQQNRPQREVVESQIINPDEVLNPRIGGVIRVKSQGSVTNLLPPYTGDKALVGIQYIDTVIQRRTGVSQSSAALDATALNPQTATAEQIEHDANYSRTELTARNFAQMGLKRLFQKMLKTIVRYQDRPRTIRLRDTWVDMDPRAWDASMDVTVNLGLGTGSRERDLAMLKGVAAEQDKVVQAMGPNNPIVPPSAWIGTRSKMIEAAGLKNSDEYFKPVTDQEFAQWQASQPPKVDPKMQEAQARTQIAGQKAQADVALKHGKTQADVETDRMKIATRAQADREEMLLEADLKREEMALGLHHANQTNIARPQ